MSFAIRNDGKGWRAVNSVEDVLDDEYFSEHQPEPVVITPVEDIEAVKNQARSMRMDVLNRLNGIQLSALVGGQNSVVAAIETAKQGLLDVTTIPSVVNAASADEARSAILTRYYELRQALLASAPSAVSAFEGLDT